jgi:hypothetical protein
MYIQDFFWPIIFPENGEKKKHVGKRHLRKKQAKPHQHSEGPLAIH